MDNRKVCMLASTHYPRDARIYRREAIALRDAGYEVTIALMLNDDVPEAENGISWISIPRPRNRFMRIFAGFSLMREGLRTGAAIFHIHDVELFHLAFFLRILGRKVIIDVHEAFPERISLKGWVLPGLRWVVYLGVLCWQWFFAHFANRLIVSTGAQAVYFRRGRAEVVMNFPPDIDGDIDFSNRKKLIIYVGVMYPSRLVEEMVGIGNYLGDSGYRVEIYGPMHQLDKEQLVETAKATQATELHEGFIPPALADQKISRAVFGLCLLTRTKDMNMIIPIKVFEYMARGVIPVVTVTDTLSEYIVDNENGIVLTDTDPEKIAARILALVDNPPELDRIRKRCVEDIRTKYNWEVQKKNLLKLYSEI